LSSKQGSSANFSHLRGGYREATAPVSVPKCLESGHFGTSVDMSYGQFGTGAGTVLGPKCLYTFRIRVSMRVSLV